MNVESLDLVNDDYKNRMLQFEIDCNDGKGTGYACHSVGEFHAVVNKDHASAAKVLELNCDGKNHYGPSCFKLGRLLLTGKGVGQTDAGAERRFMSACDLGVTQACHHLGSLLLEGSAEVKRDPERAHKYFSKACEDQDVESCYFLAKNLLAGKGTTPRNPPEAQHKLSSSCDLGHAPSCRLLAVMFRNGDTGVLKDDEKYRSYRQKTEELVRQRGAMMGVQVA
uniref:Beta-lactamase n=1 Tax=Octactis speculum TaxID=3111310 RepID=A0A7S2DAY3_9STRA|mmetsp:Transcript_46347/g.63099  ORF Transcript_46347/g.63099 Transcript_46347/m.63099 type:complete len:224 (+) Transcript_46347:24-695(+)|eukprot:CAMPEP_0185771076 /NCGR_PEP_ID=MMETSP1174-20130828/63043_1 /TAXON_ID=35687 /ORGANISM="Dictyocha speculum, Strain CCMP1381" /LENGTH=223 /DNA_ID=CAMNT_0028456807 /DNA_START=22 /DNA_END=693 /DNA_ORIENTATION=+